MTRNSKSESAKADPAAVEDTYGIDHLTIFEDTHSLDDYKRLIAQCRICHMANKINNDKRLTCECNVLSNILHPMKRAK